MSELMKKGLENYAARIAEQDRRIKALKRALRGYVDECTNDECEPCIYARAVLKEADQ